MSDPDLITKIKPIADFLGLGRRQAQYLHESGLLPTFYIGSTVCARRSTLTAWLFEQEQKARATREG